LGRETANAFERSREIPNSWSWILRSVFSVIFEHPPADMLPGDREGISWRRMQHGGMSRRVAIVFQHRSIFTYLTSFFKPFSSAAVRSLKHGRYPSYTMPCTSTRF
jgi:hypothetical protein